MDPHYSSGFECELLKNQNRYQMDMHVDQQVEQLYQPNLFSEMHF